MSEPSKEAVTVLQEHQDAAREAVRGHLSGYIEEGECVAKVALAIARAAAKARLEEHDIECAWCSEEKKRCAHGAELERLAGEDSHEAPTSH